MKLKASKREILGKKVKKLREQGSLPAVVFGKEIGSRGIALDKKEFEKLYDAVGESTLIDLQVDNEGPLKVLISGVDTDPVSDEIIHANLQAVKLTEKTTAMIPIEIVGESPIVKSGDGILLTLFDEVEVEALPQDLPSEIKVDVSNLTEIDQGIAIKDLPVNRSEVEIKHGSEELVVKVEHAEMKEEEGPAAEVPIEEAVEVTTEKKEEEGKEGEEGPAKPEKAGAKKKS